MNSKDSLGIVHERGLWGPAKCGQEGARFWQETQDEVDCMACIERKAHLEALRAALSHTWFPTPAVTIAEEAEDGVLSISVHDEIPVP